MCEVITKIQEITTEWLTTKLYVSGALHQGEVVSIQKTRRKHHSETWFADIVHLEVGYSGESPSSAPERLFLKLSKTNLDSAELAYGRKEVEFYNKIAKTMNDPPIPRCYDAAYDPVTGRSHILLDDLSETHDQPQPPLPPSKQECEQVMDCLAAFHAYWWEHPRLGTDIGKVDYEKTLKSEHPGIPYSLGETEQMFSCFVDFLGDRLSIARRKIFEEVLASWPFCSLSKRLNERRAITLVHKDAHVWNFLYPNDPEHYRVRIIDWHEWGIGVGPNDLTEMIVLWWYSERRARLEEPLVRRYHNHLLEHGVKDYDWAQCWYDYRLFAISVLLYPVWMHAVGRSPTFWWPILERGILAFQDLRCGDLLE